MQCIRQCGRRAANGKRLCQSCQERQLLREEDNGRWRYGRKTAREGRKYWGSWWPDKLAEKYAGGSRGVSIVINNPNFADRRSVGELMARLSEAADSGK